MRTFLLDTRFYSVITLWLLTSIVFGLVRLTGDPVKMKAEAGADEAYMAQLRRDWGLTSPYTTSTSASWRTWCRATSATPSRSLSPCARSISSAYPTR